VSHLAIPYACPVCKTNRTHFEVICKIAREIHKDPDTGENIYIAPELEVVLRTGKPEIDVKCLSCGYTGHEGIFAKAARR
jgi:rubredoxin